MRERIVGGRRVVIYGQGGKGLQNLCLQSFSHNFQNTVHNWHLKALGDMFVLEYL